MHTKVHNAMHNIFVANYNMSMYGGTDCLRLLLYMQMVITILCVCAGLVQRSYMVPVAGAEKWGGGGLSPLIFPNIPINAIIIHDTSWFQK